MKLIITFSIPNTRLYIESYEVSRFYSDLIPGFLSLVPREETQSTIHLNINTILKIEETAQ